MAGQDRHGTGAGFRDSLQRQRAAVRHMILPARWGARSSQTEAHCLSKATWGFLMRSRRKSGNSGIRLEVVGVKGGPQMDPARGARGCLCGMRERTSGGDRGPSIRPSSPPCTGVCLGKSTSQ